MKYLFLTLFFLSACVTTQTQVEDEKPCKCIYTEQLQGIAMTQGGTLFEAVDSTITHERLALSMQEMWSMMDSIALQPDGKIISFPFFSEGGMYFMQVIFPLSEMQPIPYRAGRYTELEILLECHKK